MTQKKSNKEEDIMLKIDKAINELVYEKTSLIKAYNYYHGKRDPEQFRHLEENYGIGTPTSVEFIPLVRKHIDVLIGEYLSTPISPKISCKDEKTLSNIHRDKQIAINQAVVTELKSYLKGQLSSDPAISQTTAKMIENKIQTLMKELDENFISSYEIAAQNMVDYSMQSRNIDFLNKRKIILTDLLISGTCYYKVCPHASGSSVNFRVLNPLNTFIERNPESPYLKHSGRSVIREYLTKHQILNKYGHYLKEDDLDTIEDMDYLGESGTTTYIRGFETAVSTAVISDGVLGGYEITPMLPYDRNSSRYFRMYPVYEVEWLESELEDGKYVMNRYEGIRIGTEIYIPIGKSENVVRSMDDPTHCDLLVNGIFYSDRNGDPFSLVLSTANLQDKNDVLHFYRDNVIAESGTAGDWVDLAYVPKVFGEELTERLLKWKAYKKQGLAIIDSSQEGLPPMNTTFGGFDDTIKLQTIQAIDLAIQRNEETCSMITGVFREKLGGVEQRDAVTNVQVGIRQSSYITKQYYQLMDLMTREILLDILNVGKIVYKKGVTGTLVLGDKLNKVFTALPEHFTVSDHDIHIVDTSEVKIEQETMKQLAMEFTKGGASDPELIINMITASGLTNMKAEIKKSLNKRKEENDQAGQLNQQVQQLDQQLKEVSTEAQKLQKEVQRLNSEKLELEKQRLAFEKELEWYKAKTENSYKQGMVEANKKRVELEAMQLVDNNPNNDEIRDR